MTNKSFERTDRVSELLKQQIASALLHEKQRFSVPFITVSYVDVSKDLSSARIYITLFEDSAEITKRVLAELNEHKAYFRRYLSMHTKLRITPNVFFYYDETSRHARHINQLISAVDRKTHED